MLLSLGEALHKLDKIGRLEVVEADPREDKQVGKIMGYYSSYTNTVHVVIRKEDFDKKWFGLFTDYDNFNKESVVKIFYIFLHELCHYTAHNQTLGYRRVWNSPQKLLLQQVMIELITEYGDLFMPEGLNGKIRLKTLLDDPGFNRAFSVYYESIRRSDMIRIVNLQNLYSITSDNMYKAVAFKWARFFENVMIAAMEISYGEPTSASKALYKALRNGYLSFWPGLRESTRFNSLFYQEVLYPSEISCIVVGSGEHVRDRKIKDMALKTLALI